MNKLVIDYRKGIHTEACDSLEILDMPRLSEIRKACKEQRFRISIQKEGSGWRCKIRTEDGTEDFVDALYEELEQISDEFLSECEIPEGE